MTGNIPRAMTPYFKNVMPYYQVIVIAGPRINPTLIYDGEPTPPAILNIRDI